MKDFSPTALSGRPAEEQKVKPEVPPALPAPQKERAKPEDFPDIVPQVFPVKAMWSCHWGLFWSIASRQVLPREAEGFSTITLNLTLAQLRLSV